ncbi:GCG_CRPN prefix-to-repeats domain-containing protein [Bradyrhizobium sp. HKCCYLS1011]|uniref:GCG_CRPN prefix-to-repeats domain-containing protein n=1 Tax=Bradyrhizobium sp. HKCCYLS1011 TaxID=3420733 RepID=UPI003EBCB4F0
MKMLAASALALGLGLFGLTGAQAAPLAPVVPAIDQAASFGEIILVAQGCGPGWHRGPYGACRPLYSCPPGWHSGPFGKRCFRNW